MPPKYEEIIVATHPRHAQQRCPDPGHARFEIIGRCCVRFRHDCVIARGRQGTPIQLAVDVQRPCRHQHVRTRHHVLRQRVRQALAQFCNGQDHPFICQYVRHQPLDARCLLTCQHHCLAYPHARPQTGFDLPQLDTEAADLDLEVIAAQILQRTVGAPTHQVAGTVQSRVRIPSEGIRNEALRGKFGTIEVAPGHAIAADMQFARHPQRNQLSRCVQHVHAGVADGSTDRNRTLSRCHRDDLVRGRIGGRFGGTVDVEHALRPNLSVHETSCDDGVHGLASGQQMAQATQHRFELIHQLIEQPGGQHHRGDASGRKHRRECGRIAHLRGSDHLHACTVQQRAPDLPRGRIERRARAVCYAVVTAQWRVVTVDDQPQYVAVLDHHPLGLTGRPRRVDHVSQVPAHQPRYVRCMLGLRRSNAGLRGFVDIQPRHRQVAVQSTMAQQNDGGTIVELPRKARHRSTGFERYVGTTGLQHRQHGHHEVDTPLHAQRHTIIRTYPHSDQAVRQLIGTPLQLGIGHVRRPLAQCNRIGLRLCLRAEAITDQPILGIRHPGRVELMKQLMALRSGE
ncbi:hypothetical protein CPBF367_38880 [Xanthomonas arboricola pv. juglandis]|nr:hypothetical protein CPBF367_38880 [Xanthomonas arboricola pv. juglandis]